ncbi:MAG: hypothetical protein J7L14_01425, partial [Candidatus Diapherotrites archaeon]|nr:hypothetical protein [Candidatus Diapherotrites archaeon]
AERNVGYFIRAVTRIIREQPQALIGIGGKMHAISTIRKILDREPGIVAVQLNESKLRPLYLITTKRRLAEALAELAERNVGYFIRAVTRIIREQPQALIGFVGDVRAILRNLSERVRAKLRTTANPEERKKLERMDIELRKLTNMLNRI